MIQLVEMEACLLCPIPQLGHLKWCMMLDASHLNLLQYIERTFLDLNNFNGIEGRV